MENKQLTPKVEADRKIIEEQAKLYGLDFFPTIYEMVDYDQMSELAAFGGFPTRYQHWRFGMEYEQLSKSYEYGLSKIYEMVINTNPAIAYLLEGNQHVDQKLVMAHVFAHVDFFKNNYCFEPTNRKMIDKMANHGARIRNYIDIHGVEVVEDFIDTCLSIDTLIDINSLYIKRPDAEAASSAVEDMSEDEYVRHNIRKILSTDRNYMEEYLNPTEFMKQQDTELRKQYRHIVSQTKFPKAPKRDILEFLSKHAPLEKWQRNVLSIIRDEAYYFAPQGMTKIMNEGWAVFWHSKMMTGSDKHNFYQIEYALDPIATAEEIVSYCDATSGTTAVGRSLNPYKMGWELFKDVERRWNTGRHGKVFEECSIDDVLDNWDDYVVFNNIHAAAGDNVALLHERWNKYSALKLWLEDARTNESSVLAHFTPAEIWHRLFDKESECALDIASNSDVTAVQRIAKERTQFEHDYIEGTYTAALRDRTTNPDWLAYAKSHGERIPVGVGREKIFQVRKSCNDVTFIDNYFSMQFAVEQKMFTVEYSTRSDAWYIASKEFDQIKQKLLFMRTNFGNPFVTLDDANYNNRGELLVNHHYVGIPLDFKWAQDVLSNLEKVWKRPVNLRTIYEEQPVILHCKDGKTRMKEVKE